MIGVEHLLSSLRAKQLKVEGPLLSSNGWQWLVLRDYEIVGGRFDGKVVSIGVPVPADFPATPPGGLYVSPQIVPPALMGGLNVHDRSNETGGLPGEWQYWSRPIPPGTWRPADAARRLLTHWNAVMLNAN